MKGLLVAAGLLLAAEPPDPGSPSIIALGATLGGIVGGLLAHLRGCPREVVRNSSGDCALVGGLLGIWLYLAMFVL